MSTEVLLLDLTWLESQNYIGFLILDNQC